MVKMLLDSYRLGKAATKVSTVQSYCGFYSITSIVNNKHLYITCNFMYEMCVYPFDNYII